MKLNKVLALALSGVMAVSMLAGCKGGSANGEQDNTEQPVVSTDAVKVMNDAQKDVVFANDEALASALKAAVAKAKTTDIEGATYNAQQVKSNSKEDIGKNIYASLNTKVTGLSSTPMNDSTSGYGKVVLSAGQKVMINLYIVEADGLDEAQALKIVAKDMKTDEYTDAYSNKTTTNKDLKAEYTGAVSVEKVVKTNEDGDTHSAYLIAVSVTQTVTETSDAITNNT